MLPIAGQTAGPIGLIFFVDGCPGDVIGEKKFDFFSRATPSLSASKSYYSTINNLSFSQKG